MLRKIGKSTIKLLPAWVQYGINSLKSSIFGKLIIKNWEKAGRPVPPPNQFKQALVKYYQQYSKYSVLIETGTYMGDMVAAQRKNFNKIFSIELGESLWYKATKRFSKYKHIKIYQGDSGNVLPNIINQLDEPAIFWLDAHYSAGITAKGDTECPIFKELESIFRGKEFAHIILLDDARCFNGEGDYPTIDEMTKYIQSKSHRYKVLVKDDIIRYVPD